MTIRDFPIADGFVLLNTLSHLLKSFFYPVFLGILLSFSSCGGGDGGGGGGGGGGGDRKEGSAQDPSDDSDPPPVSTSLALISAGSAHACSVFENGEVKCWGDNRYGQLGQGDTNHRGDQENEMGGRLPVVGLGIGGAVKDLGVGGGHTCALLSNKSLKCWGKNDHGQLGQEDTDRRGDGADEMGNNLLSVDLGSNKTVKMVATGENYTCALLNDDTVKCWGENTSGQLGQQDTDTRGDGENEMGDDLSTVNLGTEKFAKTIVAGYKHVCAILNDDTVKCWGENNDGQLGQGHDGKRGDEADEMGDNLSITDLGMGKSAKAISAGGNHTCALLNDDSIKCWGSNNDGQLGLEDTDNRGDESDEMDDSLSAIDLGTGRTAKAITAGRNHTCALLDNNTIKCWGNNVYGRLGLGDTNNRGDGTNEMGDHLLSVNLATNNRTIVDIAAGSNYTCALFDDSSIKCWGQNDSGRLGLSDISNRGDGTDEMGYNLSVVDLGVGGNLANAVLKSPTVAIGDDHTCVLLDGQRVKCWGGNDHGQLGVGNVDDLGDGLNEMGTNLLDVEFGTGKTVKDITAGDQHTCVLLNDDSVKCWGRNNQGQLGLEDKNNRGDGADEMGDKLPAVELGTGRTVKSVTAGNYHNCVLLDDNSIKCWGVNNYGQLGQGNTDSLGDDEDEMGQNLPTVDIGSGTVKSIVSRGNHTCVLLSNGTIKCWGRNTDGRLGLGDTNDRGDQADEMGGNLSVLDLGTEKYALSVATGNYHTCALLNDKTVKCWGQNIYGELGQDDNVSRGDEANEMGDNLGVVNLGTGRTTKFIAVGRSHSCALLDDDSVKCWGRNGSGQLGIENDGHQGNESGEMDDLPSVAVGTGRTVRSLFAGERQTCAVLDDYSIKCWGDNSYGELGRGDTANRGDEENEMGDDLLVIDLAERDLATGGNHTCTLLGDGRIKCWGSNGYGELGLGDTDHRGDNTNEMGENLPFVNLGTGQTAKAVTVGRHHSCALLNDNSVKCWGRNDFGQLGLGDILNRGDEADEMGDNLPAVNLGSAIIVRDIYAGNDHTCALLNDNSIKCWGANSSGQLGQGDINHRGDGLSEMGDRLLSIDLGSDRTAQTIGIGGNHTCALLDDDTVKCWGNNDQGQLGQGDTNNRGDGASEMGDDLSTLVFGTNKTPTAVTVGANHTCALFDDDTLKCWGGNTYGQLGQGNTDVQGDGANEMGDSLSIVDLDSEDAQMITVGGDHSCALLNDYSLRCWGRNDYGQLGLEDINDRGDERSEMGRNLSAVELGTRRNGRVVAVGENHSCVLLRNNSIKCWGYNNRGQLGLGSTGNQGDGSGEMDDNLTSVKL